MRENTLALPTFVAICQQYKIDPVTLLLDMGQFTRRQAQDMRQVRGLDTYTDLELVGELYRRTVAASAGAGA